MPNFGSSHTFSLFYVGSQVNILGMPLLNQLIDRKHSRDMIPWQPFPVVTFRHPSKGGPVGTSSDDGIRRDPSRLRVITGAQPKAGTGLKMQTVRFFNVTLLEIYR